MAYNNQNVINYPDNEKILSVSDLFGFSEAKQTIDIESSQVVEEQTFVPYRIFVNHIDTYLGRELVEFLSDQEFGKKKPLKEHDEQEEFEEQLLEDVQEMQDDGITAKGPVAVHNYEIIGTVHDPSIKTPEDVKEIISDPSDRETFAKKILSCGFIIFDITKDPGQISEASWALKAIDEHLKKLKESSPKAFRKLNELRVFIVISTVLTWALTKPIDPEEPDSPFIENDYRKRKPHPNYKKHIALEKEVIRTGRKHSSKLKAMVIASGVMYGGKQDVLHFLFKMAWHNEPSLPIFGPGRNFIPLIHFKDLIKILHNILEVFPDKLRYLLAVESPVATLSQITRAISKALGSGKTHNVKMEEAFLFPEITQQLYDTLTMNLNMEPVYISEMNWLSKGNFTDNIQQVVEEYKNSRGLHPLKIFVHGPPAVGKTVLSRNLCGHYKLHHLTVQSVVEEAISNLKARLEQAAAKEQGSERTEEEEEEVVEEEENEELLEETRQLLSAVQASVEKTGLPDESHLLRFFKECLASNPCQNQGYVLDGFPSTLDQAQDLFAPPEDLDMDTEVEVEDAGVPFNRKTLPEFAISLEASDDFLWERVIDMPEKELQASPYSEEKMVIKLSEFRQNNSDELTVINYFDEAEVHCMTYVVSDDMSKFLDDTLKDIVGKIGKPRNYGPSAEEILLLQKEEEEKIKAQQLEREQEEEKIQKKIHEEHVAKMEEWATLLNKMKEEEAAVLAVRGVPMREYLMKNVFPVLTKGLLEVVRTRPSDPVDFLAEFLFMENPEGKMFQPVMEGKYNSKSNK